ncbi:aa3-type cytochrome c oxidase subunit IV [Enterovirga aerilata]|uniref:Aa3-type cytochrome c oxidase subunit IV n=1 Tax=Enterovirga aerilata TaxID=2730920 RepID=A0A849HUG9_9HYPH|nr:aa3-type cytochrome c oxidase subunit IV [Enterovirga sp. DB1703]NNM71146.1 aa3-type cytochrome c oxidase subunit IV [Enterovirga sp. DB1703]
MAETGNAERLYSPDMDARAHEATYNAFTHFTAVGTVFAASIVTALAVGGVKGGWVSAIVMIVLAHVAAAVGLFSTSLSWRPGAVVMAILLLMLLLY